MGQTELQSTAIEQSATGELGTDTTFEDVPLLVVEIRIVGLSRIIVGV